jgi:hypothetical protein
MIIFTASDQAYADSVLSYIDPMRSYFKHRLYRNNCYKTTTENGSIYVKDLRVIKNIPLSNMIIIDNSVLSFAFQLDNGIPILPFYSNKDDIEMNFLKNYLIKLVKYDNIVSQNSLNFNLKQVLAEALSTSPNSPNSPSSSFAKSSEEDVNKSKKDEKTESLESNDKKKSVVVKPSSKLTDKSYLAKGKETLINILQVQTTSEKSDKRVNGVRRKSKIQNQIFETMENAKKFK